MKTIDRKYALIFGLILFSLLAWYWIPGKNKFANKNIVYSNTISHNKYDSKVSITRYWQRKNVYVGFEIKTEFPILPFFQGKSVLLKVIDNNCDKKADIVEFSYIPYKKNKRLFYVFKCNKKNKYSCNQRVKQKQIIKIFRNINKYLNKHLPAYQNKFSEKQIAEFGIIISLNIHVLLSN